MSTPRFRSLCTMCEYYVPGTAEENTRGKPVCRAFPEGIPEEILHDGYDHRQPLHDETILFSPAEGVTEEDVNEWEENVLEQEKEDMQAVVDQFREADLPE